jgi:hypothetical protein
MSFFTVSKTDFSQMADSALQQRKARQNKSRKVTSQMNGVKILQSDPDLNTLLKEGVSWFLAADLQSLPNPYAWVQGNNKDKVMEGEPTDFYIRLINLMREKNKNPVLAKNGTWLSFRTLQVFYSVAVSQDYFYDNPLIAWSCERNHIIKAVDKAVAEIKKLPKTNRKVHHTVKIEKILTTRNVDIKSKKNPDAPLLQKKINGEVKIVEYELEVRAYGKPTKMDKFMASLPRSFFKWALDNINLLPADKSALHLKIDKDIWTFFEIDPFDNPLALESLKQRFFGLLSSFDLTEKKADVPIPELPDNGGEEMKSAEGDSDDDGEEPDNTLVYNYIDGVKQAKMVMESLIQDAGVYVLLYKANTNDLMVKVLTSTTIPTSIFSQDRPFYFGIKLDDGSSRVQPGPPNGYTMDKSFKHEINNIEYNAPNTITANNPNGSFPQSSANKKKKAKPK